MLTVECNSVGYLFVYSKVIYGHGDLTGIAFLVIQLCLNNVPVNSSILKIYQQTSTVGVAPCVFAIG